MAKVLKIICAVLIIGSLITPNFSLAATSSLQIHQQAGDVTPPGGGGGSGGFADTVPPQISEVTVTVQFNSVTINWKTVHEDSTSKVAWGPNQDYSDGVVSSAQLLRNHSEQIDSLRENALYYFLITAIDSSGNQSFYEGRFITASKQDVTPPLNVQNFTALPNQNNISLSWNNPPDSDFIFTRVVRSTGFFPTDPFNGLVVYEGADQSFVDTDVVPGKIYYYSAFTRDLTGNYSSGALSSAMIVWYSESGAPIVDLQFIYSKDIPSTRLTINDFVFSYKNGEVKLPSNKLVVPQSENLFITIDKRKLPAGTKFLMWNSSIGEYLFSLNPDTGNYELTLPKFTAQPQGKIVISLFNNLNQIIQDVPLVLRIVSGGESRGIVVSARQFNWLWVLLLLLILIILLVIRLLMTKKEKDKKD